MTYLNPINLIPNIATLPAVPAEQAPIVQQTSSLGQRIINSPAYPVVKTIAQIIAVAVIAYIAVKVIIHCWNKCFPSIAPPTNETLIYEAELKQTCYPQKFKTKAPVNEKGLIELPILRDSGTDYEDEYSKITKLDQMNGNLKFALSDKTHLYDIYDIQFQNLALSLTKDLKAGKLLKLQYEGFGSMLLYRARTVAITSRSDLDWTGNFLTKEAEKKKKESEIQTYYKSLTIYNPSGTMTELFIPPKKPNAIPFTVVCETTTQKLSEMLKDTADGKNPKEIAALIMANRKRMGGGHQKMLGTQEEQTGSDCGLFPILGTVCERMKSGEKGRISYLNGYALPPGGVAYLDTRLLDGSNNGEGSDCSLIVAGFADFRRHSPESERSDYSSFTGNLVFDENYRKRIKLDMYAVLDCAIQQGKTRLLLGGSGCGAFEHDPVEEAKAWKEVLTDKRYAGYFKEVVFAIYDTNTSKIFNDAFNTNL